MADLHVMGPRLYSCCNCRNHVALHDDVISKAFQGRNGRAFLFSHAMNVVIGAREDRQLMTGLHTVADVYCSDCHEVIGWKYERAYERTQKYKEGKFILEKSKIVQENWCNSIVDMFFILYSKRDRRLDYHGNFLMLLTKYLSLLTLDAMEHLRMLDEYIAPRELRGEVLEALLLDYSPCLALCNFSI